MAFDNLQEKLTKTLKKLQGKGKLSTKNMEETLKDIRLALLEADVNYGVVKDFLNKVQHQALGQEVLTSLEPGQALVKIVNDELIALLGQEEDINYKKNGVTVILMVGLQGSGKTTHAVKIANKLQKLNKKVLLGACDLIRPAAYEQLQTLANNINCPVFKPLIGLGAIKTAEEAYKYAINNNYDILIIDSSGRLQIDEELMAELKTIKDVIKPDEILLTVDALTGQDIVNVADSFNEQLTISGLVVTKFDGDSKGGGVLSVRAKTNVPIKFIGNGEKIDDLEKFHPDRLASRILGMGDIVTLVEKAQEKFDMQKAEEDAKKMLAGHFTMNDLLKQIEHSQKLGPLSMIAKMLPGMGDYSKMLADGDAEEQLIKTKAMIQSMTAEEREHPDLIRSSRKQRIALGSGCSTSDVNRLLNQYEKMKKIMKQMSGFRNLLGL